MIPAPHVIMDTTLRDGEQAPNVRFTPEEKAEYVRYAEDAGVRYIEVGFPLNKYDMPACRAAAKAAKQSRLVGMGITTKESVDACAAVGVHEIVFVVPSSRSHLSSVTGESVSTITANMINSAHYALSKDLIPTVGFEDASQGDTEIISYILQAMINSRIPFGCLRIGDTRGQLTPNECVRLVEQFHDNRPNRGCRIAFHAHNDLGCATANAFSTLTSEKPVDCIHATTLGLGERAGNASLEQVATLIDRKTTIPIDFNWPKLNDLTRYLSEIAFVMPLPYQPIVGERIFSHEAGLHQKGVMADPTNYEYLSAQKYGRRSELILGKHSGRAFKNHIVENVGLTHEEVDNLVDRLVTIAKEPYAVRFKNIREIYQNELKMGTTIEEIIKNR